MLSIVWAYLIVLRGKSPLFQGGWGSCTGVSYSGVSKSSHNERHCEGIARGSPLQIVRHCEGFARGNPSNLGLRSIATKQAAGQIAGDCLE